MDAIDHWAIMGFAVGRLAEPRNAPGGFRDRDDSWSANGNGTIHCWIAPQLATWRQSTLGLLLRCLHALLALLRGLGLHRIWSRIEPPLERNNPVGACEGHLLPDCGVEVLSGDDARDRSAQGREIETLYRENILPLPMAAKFSGATVFDVWEVFSANPTVGLKSALGVTGEFEAGRDASTAGVTLVDPLTLYGWTRMGIAELVAKSPNRLAVVQATIDMLRELVEEREDQRGKKLGTFGWNGERYHLIELSEEAIEQQVADATAALQFAESLLLVPSESEQVLSEEILDMLKGMHPAYHDTQLAALQPKRAFLTDDLGIRAIAQEAGAATTWTQAFAQAGHSPGGISHPEYRSVLAALLERHHRFTQIGNVEILAELLESGWVISERLKNFARVMTGPEIDRGSVAHLLARLVIDSSRRAPDDVALATFHCEYVAACRAVGRADDPQDVYGKAATAMQTFLAGKLNRLTLPPQLMATTYLHTPFSLAREARKIAKRQTEHLFERLSSGGLTLVI